MSLVLAVDTSCSETSVALWEGSSPCIETVAANKDSHNEKLAGLVKDVIAEADFEFAELTHLVVGSGPGSFTGLRIGYSFMKGLAYSLKVPLLAVSSLKGYAGEFLSNRAVVISLGDARRSQYFCSIYSIDSKSQLISLLESEILSIQEVLSEADRIKADLSGFKGETFIVSPGPVLDCDSSFRICKPENTARGILKVLAAENSAILDLKKDCPGRRPADDFSVAELADLRPDYVRAVAARTIAERENSGAK
jgi:tRNA threonylcarbamoyl adenosine modification protein YeaZ